MRTFAHKKGSSLDTISIVIPTLNEESQIAVILKSLEPVAGNENVELIVADGGSSDGTVEIIRSFESVRLAEIGRAGRGWQMNSGAQIARGEILLFLHADVKLPDDAFEAIRQTLCGVWVGEEHLLNRQIVARQTVARQTVARQTVARQTVGGCFLIRFPSESPRSLRYVARGINLRTRLFHTATGDQAIFVRRDIFESIGGYRDMPLMEDIALFNEMKKRGRVVVLDMPIEISPRRWLQNGVWRTVLLMYALRMAYWIGVHPSTLKKFFADVR